MKSSGITRPGVLRWIAYSCAWLIATAAAASAATLPPGFTEMLVAGGLRRPTAMAMAPDGRIFVAEQQGALRVVKDGTLLPSPFVTLAVSSSGERGLIGVAFDPDFEANQFVYVHYTATSPTIHNRVSRFTASGDVAVAGSEVVVLDLEPLSATNHNGGAIHFGPDGTLFVAVGENATPSNAQALTNRLGKVLRINPDGSIPTDNPFYTVATGANRSIWALGLRNPFTFAFQPVSGAMFINDVGQSSWEEINTGVAGANYGWPATEGPTGDPRFNSPIHAYTHAEGCAISGGAFYNPATALFPPEYIGTYFFADFCGGWIRGRAAGTGAITELAADIANPVDLLVAGDGSLYYLARGSGATTGVLYRIAFGGAPRVDLTANGADGPLVLAREEPLAIALSFDTGTEPDLDPAEVYLALVTRAGVFWFDPVTRRFVAEPTRAYAGPLSGFGPVTLFDFPEAGILAPGWYAWIAMVDRDANGQPDGDVSDSVVALVP